MLTSANSRRELKKFEINSSKKSTTSVCVLISYILGLNFISRTPSVWSQNHGYLSFCCYVTMLLNSPKQEIYPKILIIHFTRHRKHTVPPWQRKSHYKMEGNSRFLPPPQPPMMITITSHLKSSMMMPAVFNYLFQSLQTDAPYIWSWLLPSTPG